MESTWIEASSDVGMPAHDRRGSHFPRERSSSRRQGRLRGGECWAGAGHSTDTRPASSRLVRSTSSVTHNGLNASRAPNWCSSEPRVSSSE
jgi:hypothetical protein